jgi:hypothetical protein
MDGHPPHYKAVVTPAHVARLGDASDMTHSSLQAAVALTLFHLADILRMRAPSYQRSQAVTESCTAASRVTEQEFQKFLISFVPTTGTLAEFVGEICPYGQVLRP